jgi:hypothetical protein
MDGLFDLSTPFAGDQFHGLRLVLLGTVSSRPAVSPQLRNVTSSVLILRS